MNTNMDIDLVYLWVNGNDPKWRAKRDAYIGKPTQSQTNCEGRYAENGELKYSLRSVEKYAPWIRRIFIVTDNQTPEWLDTDNPKIRIVDHTEIMPKECLPCFNSAVIELFLDKIPGLSEHFLYANDDMYFNRPVFPETFFAHDGKPYVFLIRKHFRKLALFYREKVLGKTLNPHLQTINNASKLVERHYGKYYSGKPHHNIDVYLKSTVTLTNEVFKEEFRKMWEHHERSREDIERCVYSYAALAEKRAHLQYTTNTFSFRIEIAEREQYKRFEQCQPQLFCTNDSERASNADRLFAAEYINKLFPEKSEYEK